MNYSDQDLYYAVKNAKTISGVLRNLGFSDKRGHQKILAHIRELDLDISHIKIKGQYSENDVREAVKTSISIREVLKKLSLKPAGGNYTTIRNYISSLNLDISHFRGKGHLKGKRHDWAKKTPLKEILVKNSSYKGTNHSLKPRLIKSRVLAEKCYGKNCSVISAVWLGKPLSLHLDHINGDKHDFRLENLRFLCPNCHSQTSTYCGKNKGAYGPS